MNPPHVCSCADGALAGYFGVAVFLAIFLLPRILGAVAERKRARAVAEVEQSHTGAVAPDLDRGLHRAVAAETAID